VLAGCTCRSSSYTSRSASGRRREGAWRSRRSLRPRRVRARSPRPRPHARAARQIACQCTHIMCPDSGTRTRSALANPAGRLISEQIYSQIAVPMRGGIYRPRSLAMLAEVLSAVRVREARRWTLGFDDRGSSNSSLSSAPARVETSHSRRSQPGMPHEGRHRRRPSLPMVLTRATSLARVSSVVFETSEGSRDGRFSPARMLQRDERVWERLGGGMVPFMPTPPTASARSVSTSFGTGWEGPDLGSMAMRVGDSFIEIADTLTLRSKPSRPPVVAIVARASSGGSSALSVAVIEAANVRVVDRGGAAAA